MLISIWRYSHLTLAVSSFLFLIIASVTGLILAFEPVTDNLELATVPTGKNVPLTETLIALQNQYDEVLDLKVDQNDFVIASVISEDGMGEFYIDPKSAKKAGEITERAAIYEWCTNFHRSLLLKSTGRVIVGFVSFLLSLITVTGIILIIKRQQGIRHFFNQIIKDNFYQYAHTYLGRLFLIPILIIALSGVYLSLARFEIIPPAEVENPNIDFDHISISPKRDLTDFPAFQNITLDQVVSVEFPFSSDPEDYYTIKLHDREIRVNQITGEELSLVNSPIVQLLSDWSLTLHTGQGNPYWAIVLGLSSISILFFILSGFTITLKRRKHQIKNKYKAEESNIIILIGSESGSTTGFAKLFHQHLLNAGYKSYLDVLNKYTAYNNMQQLVVFTATYGLGEAPANAKLFESAFASLPPQNPFMFSVVGFGSHAYADFCQYAKDVDLLLDQYPDSKRLTELHTINGKSWESFTRWISDWEKQMNIDLQMPRKNPFEVRKDKANSYEVLGKSELFGFENQTFTITLKRPNSKKAIAGDLLGIFPPNDPNERLYSVGLDENGNILLSVKIHNNGVCTNYLNALNAGDFLQAISVKNNEFHFPKNNKPVLMIATGTGIAPFLGMLEQNKNNETTLFWGAKNELDFSGYQSIINRLIANKKLSTFKTAYSRASTPKTYVQDHLAAESKYVVDLLQNKGTILICGSIHMQQGVTELLQNICSTNGLKPLNHYINKGQVRMDCY